MDLNPNTKPDKLLQQPLKQHSLGFSSDLNNGFFGGGGVTE